MTSLSIAAVWIALAAQTTVVGQMRGAARAEPVLQIAAHLVRIDGRSGDVAGDSGSDTLSRYIWSEGLCSLATGEREPSRTPAVGWHVVARVAPQAGDTMQVEIEWRRMWDQKKRLPEGPRRTVSVTLHAGDRFEIDRVDAGSNGCGTAGIRLEATATRAAQTLAASGSGGRGGRASAARPGVSRGAAGGGVAGAGVSGGAAAARGGRGSGMGTGGGVATTSTARGGGGRGSSMGTGGGVGAAPTRGAGGRASAGYPSGVARGLAGAGVFTADLWLVHTGPGAAASAAAGRGGTSSPSRGGGGRAGMSRPTVGQNPREDVRHQTLRFQASGSGFAFPALSVAGDRGVVIVIVTGTISVRMTDRTPTAVIVSIHRQTTRPDAGAVAEGTSRTQEIPWDKALEVVSFELPPPGGNTQDPLAGHQIAVRLRMQ
jgi:hypothetical protein